MQFKTYLQSKLPLYLALSSLFMLASCGSYQYVGYDSDGIYSSSKEVVITEDTEPTISDNAYYKGYFAEKSQKYEKIAQDDNVIFTDIDDYEGTYNQATGEVEYEESYAGWGQNSNNVTINVYDNNWGVSPWYGFGYYRPWGFNSWGYGFYNNWGWNNWGWGAGWGYGYNNWFWNTGFGWCAPYYAYGGYYGYHNNYAHNPTRRGNYIANSGRNGYVRNDSRNYIRNNTTTRRNSSIRNTNNTRYNPANSIRSNSRSNNSNVRSNSTRRFNTTRTNTRRSNNTRSNTRINSPTRSSGSNTRINTPSRSSSSPSSTRSSSPTRSSSGSTGGRSGGTSRRGGL